MHHYYFKFLLLFQIQDATCASSEPNQRMVYMKTADGYAWRDMPAGKGYARSLRCMINMESWRHTADMDSWRHTTGMESWRHTIDMGS